MPIIAMSVTSCGSSDSNGGSSQTSQQKEFERLKNLEPHSSDYTPFIPEGILFKNESGTRVPVREYHWTNEDNGSFTKGFVYQLCYSPSKNEVVAAILGPSDDPKYAGKLDIRTKIDQSVKIPDENIYINNDPTRRYVKVKILGVKNTTDIVQMEKLGFWTPFNNMSLASFAPVKDNVINIDYSDTNLEFIFGYMCVRFKQFVSDSSLKLILPANLEFCSLAENGDIMKDYSNLVSSTIDFSKCYKITVISDIYGKWTEINLPQNVEKIYNEGIIYDNFNQQIPKWKIKINGIEKVKYFDTYSIECITGQSEFFDNISYQLNPNAFYYSGSLSPSFPSWLTVSGGIVVDSRYA